MPCLFISANTPAMFTAPFAPTTGCAVCAGSSFAASLICTQESLPSSPRIYATGSSPRDGRPEHVELGFSGKARRKAASRGGLSRPRTRARGCGNRTGRRASAHSPFALTHIAEHLIVPGGVVERRFVCPRHIHRAGCPARLYRAAAPPSPSRRCARNTPPACSGRAVPSSPAGVLP